MNGLNIEGIEAPRSLEITPKAKEKPSGFADKFKDALSQVNELQHQSDHAIQEVVQGNLGVHEGMMKVSEADISLRLLLKVRTKVLDAYREISRM